MSAWDHGCAWIGHGDYFYGAWGPGRLVDKMVSSKRARSFPETRRTVLVCIFCGNQMVAD